MLRLQKFKTFHWANRYVLATHQIPGTLLGGWVGGLHQKRKQSDLPAHPASILEGLQTSAKIHTQVDHGLDIEQCLWREPGGPRDCTLAQGVQKKPEDWRKPGKDQGGTFWAGHRPYEARAPEASYLQILWALFPHPKF